MYYFFIFLILRILVLIISILLTAAIFTLFERKLMAFVQERIGPNVVGFYGLLQPFADGLKLFLKESVNPNNSNEFIFLWAPFWFFVISFINWAPVFLYFNFSLINLNYSLLYIIGISSLSIYGLILGGWASNSKYAFLGGLRSAAQLLSYELTNGLIIISISMLVGSLNFDEVIYFQKNFWNCFIIFPLFLIFFITALAESNRPPFDLPEAEAELVSGYNVEYSSMGFALFFLGETANILFLSILIVNFFLGGCFFFCCCNIYIYILKISIVVSIYVWIRAIIPRYRYDQLMFIGWKSLLPLVFFLFIVISSCIFSF